jgi:mRNA-degrading endonuclease toxin of MazEF toxin-antitoxin module
MRRGDVWTVADGKAYAGKARLVGILQDDSFDGTESITICAFTTDDTDAPCSGLLSSRTSEMDYASPATSWWTR